LYTFLEKRIPERVDCQTIVEAEISKMENALNDLTLNDFIIPKFLHKTLFNQQNQQTNKTNLTNSTNDSNNIGAPKSSLSDPSSKLHHLSAFFYHLSAMTLLLN
jgi:hypothetical protein